MSIMIKGMDMPDKCGHCRFATAFDCGVDGQFIPTHDARRKDCPLIEVPEPHGRLIDADALLMRINHEVMEAYMDGACYGVHPSQEYLYILGEIIDEAPAVIPASEEGE